MWEEDGYMQYEFDSQALDQAVTDISALLPDLDPKYHKQFKAYLTRWQRTLEKKMRV